MGTVESELQALKQAIALEADGNEFYRLAAGKAVEEGVKAAFLFLAGEEQKHRRLLERLYRDVSAKSDVDWAESLDEIEPPEIFNWDEILPERGSLPVSVFRIAMLMEKHALEYYQGAAKATANAQLSAFFKKMVEWETAHLIKLDYFYEQAKDEWWEAQGFSPA